MTMSVTGAFEGTDTLNLEVTPALGEHVNYDARIGDVILLPSIRSEDTPLPYMIVKTFPEYVEVAGLDDRDENVIVVGITYYALKKEGATYLWRRPNPAL